MVFGQLTLGIPGAGASDFATTPIPAIVLGEWPADTPPTRQEFNYAVLQGRSSYGTPQVDGPAYGITYAWTVAAWLTMPEMLQLGALAKWQDRTYKTPADGKLRLIDEVRELDPEPSPHSRTLLSPLAPDWNAAYQYGFGVFNVKIVLPNDWDAYVGAANGVQRRIATFTLEEV